MTLDSSCSGFLFFTLCILSFVFCLLSSVFCLLLSLFYFLSFSVLGSWFLVQLVFVNSEVYF